MLTERFCFVHIPRMGGSAFKALVAANLPILGNTGHLTGPELGWLDVPRVALLRDPWSWYRSMTIHAEMVGDTVGPTYAATVRRYLYYPDGSSRAVRRGRVYCWPSWEDAVGRLLSDHGHDPADFGPLGRHRGIRATPLGAAPPAGVPTPTAEDIALWSSYGGTI